ncbi:MAG: hypothetical protein MUF77_10220 [Leptospira sp.]|nr:hypothetical protein [Leptospira sp.]
MNFAIKTAEKPESNFNKSILYISILANLNLPRAQSDVLLFLHSFCANGLTCFPSLQALQIRSGGKYKIKRISQILQELKWKGWITITRKGPFKGNEYEIHIPSGLQYFPDNSPPLKIVDPPIQKPKRKQWRKPEDTQLKLPLEIPKPLLRIIDSPKKVGCDTEAKLPDDEKAKELNPHLDKLNSELDLLLNSKESTRTRIDSLTNLMSLWDGLMDQLTDSIYQDGMQRMQKMFAQIKKENG